MGSLSAMKKKPNQALEQRPQCVLFRTLHSLLLRPPAAVVVAHLDLSFTCDLRVAVGGPHIFATRCLCPQLIFLALARERSRASF